jgi:hypothetical protein
MTTLTCAEVETQIELFAAAECDGPTQTAIAKHLAECTKCAGAAEEVGMLLGLLTLRHRERNALQRLRQSIQEDNAVGPVTLPLRKHSGLTRFGQRVIAVAALFLCVVGLWSLLDALRPVGPGTYDGQVAQVQPKNLHNGRGFPEKVDHSLTKVFPPGPGAETYGFTFLFSEAAPEFLRSHPCVAGRWQFQKETASHWIGTLSDATGNVAPSYPADGESTTVENIKIKKSPNVKIVLKTWQGQVILRQPDPAIRFGSPKSLESAFHLIGHETTPGGAETRLFKKRPELTYQIPKP